MVSYSWTIYGIAQKNNEHLFSVHIWAVTYPISWNIEVGEEVHGELFVDWQAQDLRGAEEWRVICESTSAGTPTMRSVVLNYRKCCRVLRNSYKRLEKVVVKWIGRTVHIYWDMWEAAGQILQIIRETVSILAGVHRLQCGIRENITYDDRAYALQGYCCCCDKRPEEAGMRRGISESPEKKSYAAQEDAVWNVWRGP